MTSKNALFGLPERRYIHRYPLHVPLEAALSGHKAVIVDLSLRGARIRHSRAISLGESRLRFRWEGLPFDDIVQVVASNVQSFEQTDVFETRVRFGSLSDQSTATLKTAVGTLRDHRMARWMANLHGEHTETHREHHHSTAAYVAYLLRNGRWHRQRVPANGVEPHHGFLIRTSVPHGEIRQLCAAFENSDAETRALLKILARDAM